MTARGDLTRQHLLDVAERLYGERGVGAVSLREIRIAAGSRNTAAMQFHFRDFHGLVDALIERHIPQISEIQEGLYERFVAEGRSEDPRSLVEVLVRPTAEYLRRGPSERAWVKIMGELSSSPYLRSREMRSIAPARAVDVSRRLYEMLLVDMPAAIALERMIVIAQNIVQICADRARVEEAPIEHASRVPLDVFIENFVDMRFGALFAPMSAETAQLMLGVSR
jgi:AcrR family transcriptional regulator